MGEAPIEAATFLGLPIEEEFVPEYYIEFKRLL